MSYANNELLKDWFLGQDKIKAANYARIRQENKDILNREFQRLKMIPRCDLTEQDKLRFNFSTLPWKEILDNAHHRFYDAQILKDLSCIVDTLILRHPTQASAISYNELLRHYISGLDRIGSESAFGWAYNAKIDGINNLFIIKAPRRQTDQNLLHEVFVGLHCLNKLRNKGVLNFALIYGGFPCTIPITDNTGHVLSWCNNQNPGVNYAIYEYIPTERPLKEMLIGMSIANFLNYLVQLCYALQYAAVNQRFTHRDLHMDNVLMRKLKQTSSVVMLNSDDSVSGYIETNYIPTIIDYGQSTCDGYAIKFWLDNPVYAWGDIYKFFMFCMYVLLRYEEKNGLTNNLLVECEKIYRFFDSGTEDFRSAIRTQRRYFYVLPYYPELAQKSLTTFVDYLRREYPAPFATFWTEEPPLERVLSCEHGDVVCGKSILPKLNVYPTDPWGFYDFIQLGYWSKLNAEEQLLLIDRMQAYRMMVGYTMQIGQGWAGVETYRDQGWPEYDVANRNKFMNMDELQKEGFINGFRIVYNSLVRFYDTADRFCLALKVGILIYQTLLPLNQSLTTILLSYEKWKIQMIDQILPMIEDKINYYLRRLPVIRDYRDNARVNLSPYDQLDNDERKLYIELYDEWISRIEKLQLLTGVASNVTKIHIEFDRL